MSKFKNDNYYQITGWMVNELLLKGNELLVFSIIYGFSQDGETKYTGSLKYLQDATGASRRTIINTLNSLVEKNIIGKSTEVKNDISFNYYFETARGVQKLHGGGAEIAPGGGAEIAPNNKYINNKEYNNKPENKFSGEVLNCFDSCLEFFEKHLHPGPAEKIKWLDTIEKLQRIDKIPFEKIIEIVKKTRQDSFWKSNFLSLNKLRKKKDGIMYIVIFNEKIKSKSPKQSASEKFINQFNF